MTFWILADFWYQITVASMIHDRHVHVIYVYRVWKQSLEQIDVEIAYCQQHYMMTLDHIQNSNHPKFFIDNPPVATKQWQSDAGEIINPLHTYELIGSAKHDIWTLVRDF